LSSSDLADLVVNFL